MSSFFFPLSDYYLVMSEFSYNYALFQCLSSPCVVCSRQLTLALYCAITDTVCVIVLFEYICCVDHESDTK